MEQKAEGEEKHEKAKTSPESLNALRSRLRGRQQETTGSRSERHRASAGGDRRRSDGDDDDDEDDEPWEWQLRGTDAP